MIRSRDCKGKIILFEAFIDGLVVESRDINPLMRLCGEKNKDQQQESVSHGNLIRYLKLNGGSPVDHRIISIKITSFYF